MSFTEEFKKKIFRSHLFSFNELALELFQFQVRENPVYRKFVLTLGVDPSNITALEQIPFLPVELFKKHRIVSGSFDEEAVFESSGTTQRTVSKHYIADLELYRKSFRAGFNYFFGPVEGKAFLALLPSYLERSQSSLVFMTEQLINDSNNELSGFFLNDYKKLHKVIKTAHRRKQQVILFGVSFGLLDFAEKYKIDLSADIIMETGGMKGRRKEMIREELHTCLANAFNSPNISAEYGMTELLSQAYSKEHGLFKCPPWMKVSIRDPYDPLSIVGANESGGINVIDLANIHSCAFIATQDVGRKHDDEQFEVLGRFDHSDLRGCNLMAL